MDLRLVQKVYRKNFILILTWNFACTSAPSLPLFQYAQANFGDLILPANVDVPTAQSIGKLRTLAHGVSGEVVAFDENTIVINKFKYDGRGPGNGQWAEMSI